MSILFTIGKLIGIVLLAILAIVLFLILMFFFHPVFYKTSGWIGDETKLTGHVAWLFGIFWLSYQVMDKQVWCVVRIFGIPAYKYPSAKKEEHFETPLQQNEALPGTTEEPHLEEDPSVEDAVDVPCKGDEPDSDNPPPSTKKPRFPGIQPKEYGARISSMFQKLSAELKDEQNHRAISHIYREMRRLIRHTSPRYIKGELDFATGDPAFTGQVLGLISLLPLIYQYKFHIYPDFLADEWYIRGTFRIRGHLMLIHPCISLLRMLKDKDIKRLIHKIRN